MAEDHIVVPPELAAFHAKYRGVAGRAWVADLPATAANYVRCWQLQLDGPPRHGMVGLVLPVVRADGAQAVLKLHPIDDEHPGETAALRTWNGDGAVRLLAEDPDTWTMLLEQLDDHRSLDQEPDVLKAVLIISELLVRLNAYPPPEARRLGEVAGLMLADVPAAVRSLTTEEARLVRSWAAVLGEVVSGPATSCCTGICITRTCWLVSGSRGSRSTRSRWPAIPGSPAATASPRGSESCPRPPRRGSPCSDTIAPGTCW